MTPQEALEVITNAVQTDKMTAEQDKALAIAKKALEKQIPKRVEGNDYVVRYCPNCGVCIGDEYNSFCEKCGQALDWGYTE